MGELLEVQAHTVRKEAARTGNNNGQQQRATTTGNNNGQQQRLHDDMLHATMLACCHGPGKAMKKSSWARDVEHPDPLAVGKGTCCVGRFSLTASSALSLHRFNPDRHRDD
jgi:hypothetical protein